MTNNDGGGVAYVGGFASFSSHDRADIVAHEFGHNMSLNHAPCSAVNPDPWYPRGDRAHRSVGIRFSRRRATRSAGQGRHHGILRSALDRGLSLL
ncbi:M66 family metalloprotease [Candidatus Palauibacter sp.]|uniref:M66 family metalloprotease n=1 Tax=Candidatus Palauibacter sp. TaxID=3101350 RepID=UPI003B59997B